MIQVWTQTGGQGGIPPGGAGGPGRPGAPGGPMGPRSPGGPAVHDGAHDPGQPGGHGLGLLLNILPRRVALADTETMTNKREQKTSL